MKEEQFLDNSKELSKADASLNEERLSIAGKIISLLTFIYWIFPLFLLPIGSKTS